MGLVRPSLILVVLSLALAGSAAVGAAEAASGGLRFVECISGEGAAGKARAPRPGGCAPTRSATDDGEATGIDHLLGLTASPDGRSLYAVSTRDDAVSAFTARPLRMTECFTTISGLGRNRKQPCRLLPHAGGDDVNSGFNGVDFASVSPDGRNLYTIAADGSIATFARAPSGRLAYEGCITGNRGRFGSAADGACDPIPTATDSLDGIESGLAGPRSLVVSPDGRFVYVALAKEPGIATLARGADGSLSFVGCLRGPSRFTSGGVASPCALVAPEADDPNASGLAAPKEVAISADGSSVYVVSPRQASIAEFRRDPLGGALTFSGCLSAANRGTGPGDPCRYVPQANEIGSGTGMFEMREVALAPDGTGLYGVSTFEDAVTAFARDPATGTLSFASCVSPSTELAREFGVADPCAKVPARDPEGEGSGLHQPRGLAIGADGRSLFVASSGDEAISRFRLTPGGGLHLVGCLTTKPAGAGGPCARAKARGGAPQRLGFVGLDSLAVAGHGLYAAGGRDGSISRIAFP